MGWQDRDWAKLTDSEREAIYGFRLRPAQQPADRTRWVVWTAVALLTVAVFGLALAVRHGATSFAGPQASVIRGIQGSAGSEAGVCTEQAVDRRSGQWGCVAWLLNERHLPVLAPRAYQGPCAHLLADQTTGAWTCLSGVPPPAGTVPPPSARPASPQA